MNKKPALGRGLSALLDNSSNIPINSYTEPRNESFIGEIALHSIEVNPFQPRTHFDDDALTELKDSISVHGLIQPITVRSMGTGKYQLISGERRFRASKLAGLNSVPAYIRVADDQTMLELALVENIQRQDLDAIEVAISFQRLIDECSFTQDQLSEKVGKKRSTVANYLRLLKLPAEIQLAIRDKVISMGHARALVSVDDIALQLRFFNKIIRDSLSVRKTEEMVKSGGEEVYTKLPSKSSKNHLHWEHVKMQEELSDKLVTKIEIKRDRFGKGKLVIPFSSSEDLDRIYSILNIH